MMTGPTPPLVRASTPSSGRGGHPDAASWRSPLVVVAVEAGSPRSLDFSVVAMSRAGSNAGTDAVPAVELPFDLETKLHPPLLRPSLVPRTGLLALLEAAGPVPVVAVVAPAGYGKSTLLAQWAERRRPRSAWISCDDGDNDPAVLLTGLAAALTRLGAVDAALVTRISRNADVTAVPTLMEAIDPGVDAATVVLDHVEAVVNRECQYVLTEFALRLPPGWQVVMASRHALPLPLARLRLQARLVELNAQDLAMSPDEAAALLDRAGGGVAGERAATLVELTEGWPIGLYFAGLALRTGGRPVTAISSAAVDQFLDGYLRAELFAQLSPAEIAFLVRTSVVERLCGPLCDAIVDGTGSARLLEELERRNLLVIPLDRRREWYRYHHLFRDLLLAELHRSEPGLVPLLHLRAADWLEANSRPDEAVEHAQAAGDVDRVARLVLDRMQPVWASGRVETVLRWMTWFDQGHGIERYPAIAAHGALIFALMGRSAEAERLADVAEQAPPTALLPDGSTMGGLLAYLRAILARDGVEAMRRDAAQGFDELPLTSPYRATMLHTEAVSHLLDGEPELADPLLANAVHQAARSGALPLASLGLAERCIVAAERDDWTVVDGHVGQAVSIVQEGHLETYWTSALVYAWAGRAALHRGDMATARRHAAQAARLRPLMVYSIPVVPVQALLELARVYLGLGDSGGADAALRQAEEVLAHRPDLGMLPEQARALRANLDQILDDSVGASALTAAELRLLPLLPTHLSPGQIAERLHVSHSTVKTQTNSIYRKLRVSSRGDAVIRSRELGLDLR
jgi:LuxR family transcriptional regulator, maltose regulon positive regulatory protein